MGKVSEKINVSDSGSDMDNEWTHFFQAQMSMKLVILIKWALK